jgi:NNP family nitrate/nitrite transporter-like MFS transporter
VAARPPARARTVAAALALQPAFGIVFAWGAVVPLVRARDHWPALLLGAVFSATPLGFGIGTVIGGRLADRVSPRRLCWASLGLLGAGFGVTFAAPSGLTFVVAYAGLALGVGGGVALTGAVAALAHALPGRAGTAGGLASATYAASAVFQAPLIAALAPALGWRVALEAVGLGAAALAAVLLPLMPRLPARQPGPRSGRGPLLSAPVATGGALAFCGATFGAFAAVNLPGVAGAALAGAVAAAIGLGNSGGRLLGGLVADRLGPAPVLAAVFALELAAALLLFAGTGPALALALGLGAGLALGSDAGSLARVGRDAAPTQPNAAFGLVFAAYTTGAFAGPLLGALVGAPRAWLVTAAPAVAGLAVLSAVRRLDRGDRGNRGSSRGKRAPGSP